MASSGARHTFSSMPPVLKKPGFREDVNTPVQLFDRPMGGLLMPKIKPLPSVFAVGKCPPKPRRPPHVDCDVFRRNTRKSIQASLETSNAELLPPPPDVLSSTSENPPPPETLFFPPAPPSLDLGPLDDCYDDVEFMNSTQSSLDQSISDLQELNEETYDDCDSNWPERDNKSSAETKANDWKEVKKRSDKDEKKRLEQEKREKKMQEKREQEARKKFKIKGPIVLVSTVNAKVDHKSGKNKLMLKKGETIDIIRKTENPKNYWLARNSEGQYGFVKPDTVDECTEITHNILYVHSNTDDHLKNLPTADESDADVYECVESQEDFSFPPPPPDFEFNGEDLHPPHSSESIPKLRSTSSVDEISKKCMEKEEKDFRKQFKYKGEIRVLYHATVLPSLTVKKFGNKDLIITPGEIIDVIDHPAGDKIIGRNSKGKFGYVSIANIEEDSSVYNDVEECIYDND